MGLDDKIKIIKFIKIVLITMACIYFVSWLIYLFLPKYYMLLKLELIFGFLPSIFNKFFPRLDLGYRQIPMGYMYAVGFNIICSLFCDKIKNKLKLTKEEEQERQIKRKHLAEIRIQKEKEREKAQKTQYKDTFFGLFELNLDYFDGYEKNSEELKILKIGYYKILVKKLKPKYPKIDFIVKDKIFFLSSNFVLLESITKDILKVLNIIVLTNKDNKIKTTTLFSYWLDARTINKIGIFRALDQINKLGYNNKIVILDDVYLKIQMVSDEPWCKAVPIGSYSLFKVYDNKDVKANLSAITKIY